MVSELRGTTLRFGPFELDTRSAELRNLGQKVPLQEQPFQILCLLTASPGELVTREDIRRRLWPDDTIVEFENAINAAIKKLRIALADSADEPRYIETVKRRGYRLMVPVEPLLAVSTIPQVSRTRRGLDPRVNRDPANAGHSKSKTLEGQLPEPP